MPGDPSRTSPRSGSAPSRFLAPAALVAVLIVVLIIVVSAGSSSSSGDGAGAGASGAGSGQIGGKARQAPDTATHHRSGHGSAASGSSAGSGSTSGTGTNGTATTAAGTYTVKAGDTFATISAATGASVTEIEKDNPGVSSAALSIGEVLKLR